MMKGWGWTQTCSDLKKKRKKWWGEVRKWRKRAATGSCPHADSALRRALSEYNSADRGLSNEIQHARKERWQSAISQFHVDTPVGEVWSQLKRLTGKNSHKKPPSSLKYTSLPLTDSCHKLVLDPTTQAEALGNNWAEISSNSSGSNGELKEGRNFCKNNHQKVLADLRSWATTLEVEVPSNRVEANAWLSDWSDPFDCPFNRKISEKELIAAMEISGKKSAPGADGITYQLIEDAARKSLLVLFNACLRTGVIPGAWKEGITVPVPKQQSPETVDDFRPITLLSCVGKLLDLAASISACIESL